MSGLSQITVKVDIFEGPMELLCRLVDKHELNIYDIPIADLTAQYIESMSLIRESNPMEPMSEFIVMAALLLEIKSKMLLPRKATDTDGQGDPRDELALRLEEYRRFKELAEYLKKKEAEGLTSLFRSNADDTVPPPAAPPETVEERLSRLLGGTTLSALWAAYRTAADRADDRVDKIRSGFSAVVRELFTVEDKVAALTRLLSSGVRLPFMSLFGERAVKEERIATFLALLELIRNGKAVAEQDGIFAEIYIKAMSN